MSGALKRKPLSVLLGESEDGQLHRTLDLMDLTLIGIGATVGSGVFSLIGSVAANNCGPGVLVSLGFATVACIFTGNSYIKLSRAIPSTGSVYAYAYHCLGEVFAVLAGFCLTLEYAISGFGVARSWGSKVAAEFDTPWLGNLEVSWLGSLSPVGALLSVACILLLLQGTNVGKMFTNVMTILKILVVTFMIVVSLWFFRAENLTPVILPKEVQGGKTIYGVDGFFQGTAACFWAFIGFDEICCLAGECKHPKRDMPRAVFLSVVGTAVLTILAALGLVGMQSFHNLSSDERKNLADAGFKIGFDANHVKWAGEIASWGELITLPVVVFLGVMPQARLLYAMALDGLLPLFFARLTPAGVLMKSTILIGVVGFFQTLILDFDTIADLTSAGVLLSFVLCNCCLIMLTITTGAAGGTGSEPSTLRSDASPRARGASGQSTHESVGGGAHSSRHGSVGDRAVPIGKDQRARAGTALAVFCASSFVCLLLISGLLLPSTVLGELSGANSAVRIVVAVISGLCGGVALAAFVVLATMPYCKEYGTVWAPSIGSLINFFILSTLSFEAFLQFAAVFIVALLLYFGYGVRHSAGNHEVWARATLLAEHGGTQAAITQVLNAP